MNDKLYSKQIYNILYMQIKNYIRFVLSNQDMNYYSETFGCIDRRYWGWKLVDFPEATFQRNIYPIAWYLNKIDVRKQAERETLLLSIKAGLNFSARIQHKDGSFDQAFPYEHSYGATAFLLFPLLKAFEAIKLVSENKFKEIIENMLWKAAGFLCKNEEEHGFISNHLAGAALSLYTCADYFKEQRFKKKGEIILEKIINKQSSEGWFLEYEGADPGYQTLCIYYLAQVYKRYPNKILGESLKESVDFVSCFIHPDGTFGGEYGSRRTGVFYPGGLALISDEFPMAFSMIRFMINSIIENKTINITNIDIGNLAPLVSNYLLLIDSIENKKTGDVLLPFEKDAISVDFPQAGMIVRGNRKYYSIVGISNGGVVKIFDKAMGKQIFNDCGYVGKIVSGDYLTTQVTNVNNTFTANEFEVEFLISFCKMKRVNNTPFNTIILRILNLTLMRNKYIGNLLKSILVKMLITGKKKANVFLKRKIKLSKNRIIINDEISKAKNIKFRWLEFGRCFCSIHMASANYFENFQSSYSGSFNNSIDIEALNNNDVVRHEVIV